VSATTHARGIGTVAATGSPIVSEGEPRRWSLLARAIACAAAASILLAARRGLDVEGRPSVVLAVAGLAALVAAVASFGRVVWGPQWNAPLWLSVVWIVLLGACALTADWLPIADPVKPDFAHLDQRPHLGVDEPLGTDDLGRSILSRVVFGARVTIGAAIGAVFLGALIGGAFGLLGGYFRGLFDGIASLAGDVMLSFPPLILLMAMVTVLPKNAVTISLGLGVLTIPAFFRVMRASTMALAPREFVVAARAMGSTRRRIVLRELLPNVVGPAFAYVFTVMALVIVAEGSLSYLGVGVQPPTPTWGRMIADGQAEFATAPHKVLVPSLVMFVTLYALNTIGEAARQATAPRSVL
jgi:peptide/nickel transport system permease protein